MADASNDNRLMEIYLSSLVDGRNRKDLSMKVGGINIFEGAQELDFSSSEICTTWRREYAEAGRALDFLGLINYQTSYTPEGAAEGTEPSTLSVQKGIAPVRSTGNEYNISIFKTEVQNKDGVLGDVTAQSPVAIDTNKFHVRDYNVANDRFYKYYIYPVLNGKEGQQRVVRVSSGTIQTSWTCWSITELHPVAGETQSYTVSPSDVWLFKYNVTTGEQTQNISRSEQKTLGRFPRYAQTRQNYITGTVTCLLGSEMLPMSWVDKQNYKGDVILMREGGYQEVLPFTSKLSSNDKVDMLNAWRDIVYSPNPKLLKDRKGQSFIVTLTSSTNQPQDNVRYQPDTINFGWTQIGTLDNVQILDNSPEIISQ